MTSDRGSIEAFSRVTPRWSRLLKKTLGIEALPTRHGVIDTRVEKTNDDIRIKSLHVVSASVE